MDESSNALRHGLTVDEFLDLYESGALGLADVSRFSLRPDVFTGAHLPPRSKEYADAVLDLWGRITSRRTYDPKVDEAFALDFDEYLARPFPFSGGDPEVVGQYLGAVGWFLRTVQPAVGARVVELGAGWGHLSLALAMFGCEVTAVDLNKSSIDLLRERSARWQVPLDVVESEFLDFEAHDIDLVVFFEAFHHCANPFELLDRCAAMLGPSGKLVYLADAIYDDFYSPWGVRLDGDAVFMARHAGWLELGFDRSFMYRELRARGFRLGAFQAPELGGYGTLLVADKVDLQSSFEGVLSPDEAATWHPRLDGLPGRLARERSVVTLYRSPPGTAVAVELANLTDAPLRVEVSIGGARANESVGAGSRCRVVLPVEGAYPQLQVSSDVASSSALDLGDVGVLIESITFVAHERA